MMAKTWRTIGVSALMVCLGGLVPALPGCDGGSGTPAGPNEVVKNAPGVNPAKGAVPLDEEYKNMAPEGNPAKNK